jgi:cadmium resistance protein CadD (predicted permease)
LNDSTNEAPINKEDLLELSNEERVKKGEHLKSNLIINALLIGIYMGVIMSSEVKNTWGLFTLVPLFLIYKMINNSESHKELKEAIKERNLK